ncbi:MAG: aldo/keto reductase [Coriobacteriales bacterium]|jgi:predicted aldo/keto reductase-like oxidoreductase
MKKNMLGKTGVEVGEIGFGAEWVGEMDDALLLKVMERMHGEGTNILDCWMSDPKDRSKLGRVLKGWRGEWLIQGHIGSTWQYGQYVRTRDLDKVKPAFDDLLMRLQTDHIDFGMVHYVDDLEDWDNLMSNGYIDYVHELKKSGTIGHVGISTHSATVGKVAAQSGEFESMMFSINAAYDMMPAISRIEDIQAEGALDAEELASSNPERTELYQMCEERGIGITVMKGFAGGILLDAKKSPFGVAMTPVQCISYALDQPAVSSMMVGVKTMQQAEEALAYCNASDEERDYQSVLSNAPKHSYRGQCTYCGHCSPCVKGIDIAMTNKLLDLAKAQDKVPESVREHYRNMSANADDCIACRQCESRCPFGVAIADKMAEASKVFAQN